MLAVVLTVTLSNATAQTKATAVVPYEIKVNVKGVKDSVLFLAIYTFDKQFLIDTAYKAKDGNYVFKKKRSLDKGMYMIISENKTKYVDFIVNETDKFGMSFDISNVVKTMKFTNTKENEKFMELVTFMADKTVEFADYKKDILNKNSADSTALFREKNKKMNLEVDKFRKDFIKANPTGFVSDFVRLQMEPNISNPLKTKNDTAGTIWQYQFYKNTYWSDIPLGDERILHTPIFADKMKSYFTKIVLQIPDSINAEIPKVMIRTKPSKEMFKWVMFWMTNWSETNKVMGFDAVFVYLINNYYETGEVDFYTPEQVKKITDRGKILGPLLLGKVVPELLCVDTNGIKLVQKVHIDTCKTSECLTNMYMKNKTEIDKKLVSLLALKADYTVLLFWDVDCGHCKKEVPVIFEKFKELRDKEGINIKVHAVYTQHEYDKWLKTLNEMKLQDKDWTNVVDGVHLQNLKEKFDIFSTPVIYILDKNKVIRFKRIAADQLSDVIHNLESIKKAQQEKKQ